MGEGIDFVALNGWIPNSSFVSIEIKNGENHESIGDQVWISDSGLEMEVWESSDATVLNDAMNLFKHSHKAAFRGALRRMGITF